jgi:hypothetical protein
VTRFMRRGGYETTLSLAVPFIVRMQHCARSGFDGLFFSGTNGSGSDAALWRSFGAASRWKQLTAWNGDSRSWITARAARASGRRFCIDRAGRSSPVEFIRAIARAARSILNRRLLLTPSITSIFAQKRRTKGRH